MNVVERKSSGLPRDPTSCSAHVQDGGVLLLTLSQHHLTVILTIFSTVACFWYLVLLTRRRKQRFEQDDIEEGEVDESRDVVQRKSDDLERCQDCVGYIDLSFGLFQLTAFIVLQYLPQIIQGESTEGRYIWAYLGQWHIAAVLKTLWFLLTLVTHKSSLYRLCETLSVRFFRTTERPFNIIAFYMLLTSYMLLPVVIDIMTYYTFPAKYKYGVCLEVLKMAPLCLVVIIFYIGLIATSVVMLCIRCCRNNNINNDRATVGCRADDEPALLSDDEEDLIGEEEEEASEEGPRNQRGNNYLRNITENQNFPLEGQIKTIDEVVGYEKDKNATEEENKIVERRNKMHKLRVVAMAVLEPLLLWLWVVVVLHGNGGMSYSNNVDFGNMTLLWTLVAMCYTVVSACFRGSK